MQENPVTLIDTLAPPSKNTTITLLPQSTPEAKDTPQSLPPEVLQSAQIRLSIISDSDFFDKSWAIHLDASGRSGTVSFKRTLPYDGILRLYALNALSQGNAINSVNKAIGNGAVLLEYLSDCKLTLDDVCTSVVEDFVKNMHDTGYTAIQINNAIRVGGALYELACECGLTSNRNIVDFSYREKEKRIQRRAPDKCVYEPLDRFFFDGSRDIPNAYRCIYLILRMIPNRVSEVLSMDADCITYGLDYYVLEIPTAKETPAHIPVYKQISLSMSGLSERFLLETIMRQRELSESDSLFWDKQKRRMVTDGEFNDYLAAVIEELDIRNAKGKPAKVTSHAFRHISVAERLDCKIDPEFVRQEAAHANVAQTLAYGRKSEHDEAIAVKEIAQKALEGLTDSEDGLQEPRAVNASKFDALLNSPQTVVIPRYGVCADQNCTPQFETCIDCEHFTPDPTYLEYFETALAIINKKIDLLTKKNGSAEVLARHEQQKAVFEKYIHAIQEQVNDRKYKEA